MPVTRILSLVNQFGGTRKDHRSNFAFELQVMSLVNQLGGTEKHDVTHDADAQGAQALFHRAGLMLRLGKQVCSYMRVRLPASMLALRVLTGLRAYSVVFHC